MQLAGTAPIDTSSSINLSKCLQIDGDGGCERLGRGEERAFVLHTMEAKHSAKEGEGTYV